MGNCFTGNISSQVLLNLALLWECRISPPLTPDYSQRNTFSVSQLRSPQSHQKVLILTGLCCLSCPVALILSTGYAQASFTLANSRSEGCFQQILLSRLSFRTTRRPLVFRHGSDSRPSCSPPVSLFQFAQIKPSMNNSTRELGVRLAGHEFLQRNSDPSVPRPLQEGLGSSVYKIYRW